MGHCTRDGAEDCTCIGCKDARKIARVTAERDALRAEVEAMRGVVEAARATRAYGERDLRIGMAIAALDALRTRKAGG